MALIETALSGSQLQASGFAGGNVTGSFIENLEEPYGETLAAYDDKTIKPDQITDSLYLLSVGTNLSLWPQTQAIIGTDMFWSLAIKPLSY